MNYLDYFKDGGISDSHSSNITELHPTYYIFDEPKEHTKLYSTGWFDMLTNYLRNEKNSYKTNKDNSFNNRVKYIGDMLDKYLLPSNKPGNLREYGKPTAFWNLYNGFKQGT